MFLCPVKIFLALHLVPRGRHCIILSIQWAFQVRLGYTAGDPDWGSIPTDFARGSPDLTSPSDRRVDR